MTFLASSMCRINLISFLALECIPSMQCIFVFILIRCFFFMTLDNHVLMALEHQMEYIAKCLLPNAMFPFVYNCILHTHFFPSHVLLAFNTKENKHHHDLNGSWGSATIKANLQHANLGFLGIQITRTQSQHTNPFNDECDDLSPYIVYIKETLFIS